MNSLNPDLAIQKSGSELPHWQQGDALQFVTFRLGDALPLSLMRDWQEERAQWLATHPQPWTAETEAEYYANVLRYIRRNPLKAKLAEGRFTLWERSVEERRHSAD